MSVIDDKILYGLQKMLSDNTNITVFKEPEAVKGVEYIFLSLEDMATTLPGAGSSTYVSIVNVDFFTNMSNPRKIRNYKSKIVEALADNNYSHTTTETYYFNGTVGTIEPGDEDETDDYIFRIPYNVNHTKVS